MGYHDWGTMGWVMPLGGLLWLLFLVAVVAAIVGLIRSSRRSGGASASDRRPAGLDTLEERYAKGEIDRREYLEKKHDILAGTAGD